MKEFKMKYPNVTFHMFSGNADDIKERIDNGLIDIALLNEPVDIDKYDFIRLPKKDRWGILLLKNDPSANKDYITPEDFMNKSIMCSPRHDVQNKLFDWLGEYNDSINIVLTYNLIYNASVMVEQGLGYAVTLDGIININDDSKICFRPFLPPLETGTVLVWKKNQIYPPAVTKFIEMLKNAF